MKKITIEIRFNLWPFIKRLYSITLFFVILILIGVFYFLYNDVYLTIADAETVTSLRQKVPEQTLLKDRFFIVLDKLEKKPIQTEPNYPAITAPVLNSTTTAASTTPILIPTSTPPKIVTSSATTTKK